MHHIVDFKFAGHSAVGLFACVRSLCALAATVYLPHHFQSTADAGLVWTNAVTDALILISCCSIFAGLLLAASKLRRVAEMLPYLWILLSFGTLTMACAATCFIDLVTLSPAVYRTATVVKVVCAAVSLLAGLYFARATPSVRKGIQFLLGSFAETAKRAAGNMNNDQARADAVEASHMLVEFDMEGTILRANANYCRRMGYRLDELVGHNLELVIPDVCRPGEHAKEFWTKLRSGQIVTVQYEQADKGGETVWLEAGFHPVADPQGRPVQVIAILSDITKEIRTALALRDAEARLQVIFDHVLAGIIMIDSSGSMIAINPATVRMFEYATEEAIGRNVRMLMPDLDRKDEDSDLAVYPANGESRLTYRGRELQGLSKSGRAFPVELTLTEAMLNHQSIFIGLVRDISGRKKAEQEALRAGAELLAERMALKEANTRAALAAEAAGIGVWDWDIETNRVKSDEWLCRLYDVDPRLASHLDLEFWLNRVHPEDRAAVREALQAAIDNIEPFSSKFRVIWADGTVHFLNASGKVERDEAGKPLRMVGAILDITAVKDAEELLRVTIEKEQLLILDAREYAVLMLDKDGYVLTWNEGAEWTKGYTAQEIIGQHFSKFYLPEDIAAGKPSYELKVAAEVGKFVEEGWRVRKDGSLFWARVSITALYDRSCQLRGFGKVTQDISERKRLEEEREAQEQALRKSEELLDRTGRMAGVGGWEIDLLTSTVHWTDETARLHRLPAGHQPTLEEDISFYVPESRPLVLAAIAKAIADGQPWELEAEVVRSDGSRIWAMVNGSVDLIEGRAVRMVGAFQDVTARVIAEEELRYQANLLDLSHDTIMVRDLDGRIRFWNLGAQETYGYTKQEASGHNSHILLQTVFPVPLNEIEAEVLEKGRWEGEVEHTTQSGQHLVVASRWVLQRDQNGRTFNVLETNNDITGRKLAEAASRKAKVEAEEANRAKSEFLANMSHEIRTPMNAIMGMTHLALRANPTPDQRGYLKKIGNAADSLLNIINDILDFSKMEAGKMELESIPFSVEKLLLDLKDIVSHSARRNNIGLEFSIGKEVPAFLQGDPFRLGQILINLVNNGIKFTREGAVSVTVSAAEATDASACICFAVADTGIGMNPEQLRKLFQSFNQADPSVTRKFGGTGLGLAISKQLCTLIGGDLQVTSDEGKGSVFTLTARFDIAKGDQQALANAGGANADRRFILVVDDSADARDVLVAMLAANGFDSKMVASGEEAVAALDTAARVDHPFDLVLMDWRMPGKNGLEITRDVRARLEFAGIPSIVMVSAFDREQVMRGVIDPGLDGFLVKPVKESVLIDTITSLLKAHKHNLADAAVYSIRPGTAVQLETMAGKRVLLVEDNEMNRDLATELLSDLGILVTVAVDGREGVDRIAAEPFDLVLMDIQMPIMDGLTATRLIRMDARFTALPIIAMTAHAMSGDREKSLEAGMNDHLTKPISPDSLRSALLHWLPARPSQAVVAPSITQKERAGSDDLPEHLAPFNMKAALERTNGKPLLLRKMMLSFRQQYATAADDLRLLVSQGKNEEAQRLAHTLKSAARTLEASDLGDRAEAIEKAFRSGALEGLQLLFVSMEQALEPAIEAASTLDRRTQASAVITDSADKPRSSILIVDDDPAYVELLTDIFSNEHMIYSAADGMAAIGAATEMVPDVILLDVMMPGINGYEVCARLKSDPRTCDIPVIFLTGLGDVADETRALAMGAVDYVTKPINPLAVRARVDHQVHLKHAHDRLMKHATEDLLAQLRAEAQRAAESERINQQELQLRDHFLSHVSHELRSPLTAIYLFSTLIADGMAGSTNPKQDEYLVIIQKNISQLKSMIEDLLLVTAAKTGKLQVQLQSASLTTAVSDAIQTLQAVSDQKGVELSGSVSDDLAAYADPVRLLQVLIILCDNAIKFTPRGGTVTVGARPSPTDPDLLLVEVSDTGCGIPTEMTERIFEHLYQISEISDGGRNGLGLGLHIARELVTLQGGKIWAEGLPSAGSRFSFTVPAYRHQGELLPA